MGWWSPHTAGLQEALSKRPFSLGRGKGRAQPPPFPILGQDPQWDSCGLWNFVEACTHGTLELCRMDLGGAGARRDGRGQGG